MKKVFKKILLSALCAVLGITFAFGKEIALVEMYQLPTALPFENKKADLTGLRINIYYDDGSVEQKGFAVGNEDWVSVPANNTMINAGEVKSFSVTYKGFKLPSFSSDWASDHAIPQFEKHTANFYSNGEKIGDYQTVESYQVVFPQTNPTVSGLTFCGWSATEIPSVQSEAPALVDKSNQVMGAANVNYYAVYSITNRYTDNYGFTIDATNYNGEIQVDMVDGTKKTISLELSNVVDENEKLAFGTANTAWIGSNAKKGSIYNTTSLGNITEVVVNDGGSNFNTYYGTTQNPTSGALSQNQGYFTVSTKKEGKSTATSITVKFSANREETFYVSTQPKINFVATDANDIEEGSPSYYATFGCPENVVISSANVEAYYVTVDEDGKLNLNEAGEKIDGKLHLLANTGYLLKINQGGQIDYNFEKIAYGSSSEPNMLVHCPATAVFKPEADGNYYYKLAYGNNTEKSNLGFWWGKDDGSGNFKVKVGGALLCVPQSQAASLMRGLAFEQISGNETGLEEEMIIEDCSPAIYNLSGQRVNSVNKSGLYIVNGKTRWVNVK